jgi:hypothetical protein
MVLKLCFANHNTYQLQYDTSYSTGAVHCDLSTFSQECLTFACCTVIGTQSPQHHNDNHKVVENHENQTETSPHFEPSAVFCR